MSLKVGDRVQQIHMVKTESGPVVYHGPSVEVVEVDKDGFIYVTMPLSGNRVGPYPEGKFRQTPEPTLTELENL